MKRLAAAIALALCFGAAHAGRFLKGSRSGTGSITLTWIAPVTLSDSPALTGALGTQADDLAGFKCYKATDINGTWTLFATVASPSTLTCSSSTLVNGVLTYFQVRAYDSAGGESALGFIVSKTP